MVISTERVATCHRFSGTVLVYANSPAVIIKIAFFSSHTCPHFGHPTCKRDFQKVIWRKVTRGGAVLDPMVRKWPRWRLSPELKPSHSSSEWVWVGGGRTGKSNKGTVWILTHLVVYLSPPTGCSSGLVQIRKCDSERNTLNYISSFKSILLSRYSAVNTVLWGSWRIKLFLCPLQDIWDMAPTPESVK